MVADMSGVASTKFLDYNVEILGAAAWEISTAVVAPSIIRSQIKRPVSTLIVMFSSK